MNRLLRDGQDEYVLLCGPDREALDQMLDPMWRESAVEIRSPRDIRHHLHRFDLYFCPSNVLLPRPVPMPSVVVLADVLEAYFPQFFPTRERWARFYHHAASARLANRVVTISDYSRRGIAVFYHVPASRIDVAYPTPQDTTGTPPPLPAVPESFVLYPANSWQHKNHEGLFRALAIARHRHGVAIPCVLTGTLVPRGYDMATGIERHGLSDQVHYIGYQPEPLMAALYRRATALVLPSLFEGFGLPVVEAMAAGCPVACSRNAGLPEVAGDAAVYFAARDPDETAAVLVALWQDPKLRAALAHRGLLRAQRFSVEELVRTYREVFAAAVEDFETCGARTVPTHARLREMTRSGWQSLRSRPPRAALPPLEWPAATTLPAAR